jgi:tRNA threonylcarbamoyladenosine biosynthesis protein TsaB
LVILGIDSATPVAGVALWQDGKILREDFVNFKKTHSETLMPMVDQVLSQCEKRLEEVTALAVTLGPGSFTGLRIGLAAVKGLSLAASIPVVGVSTLDVMAHNFAFSNALVCPLLDARKQEVYTAFYDVRQAMPSKLGEEIACSPSDFVGRARRVCEESRFEKIILLGDGVYPYQSDFTEQLGEQAMLAPSHLMLPRAAALADLAAVRAAKADFDDGMALRPVYIRLSEAEYRLGKGAL